MGFLGGSQKFGKVIESRHRNWRWYNVFLLVIYKQYKNVKFLSVMPLVPAFDICHPSCLFLYNSVGFLIWNNFAIFEHFGKITAALHCYLPGGLREAVQLPKVSNLFPFSIFPQGDDLVDKEFSRVLYIFSIWGSILKCIPYSLRKENRVILYSTFNPRCNKDRLLSVCIRSNLFLS